MFVLAVHVQPTENEEAQAVMFRFNYILNTQDHVHVLVPISELIWNVKVDDIDPQQCTIKIQNKCIIRLTFCHHHWMEFK